MILSHGLAELDIEAQDMISRAFSICCAFQQPHLALFSTRPQCSFEAKAIHLSPESVSYSSARH